MHQSPTFALSNKNDFPIESGFINKIQRLEKNFTTVLTVLRKIQDDGQKAVELGSYWSKCKKLNMPKIY